MYKKSLRDASSTSKISFFPSKKGQLTIFIIIGILLILAVVLVFTLQSELATFKPEEVAPTEKGRVNTFISGCMETVGEDALFLLGLHGGYIEVPSTLAQDASQHLRLSPEEVVPYWAVGERTNVPTLSELKHELDRYIEANLRECVQSLQPFTESYTIVEKSPLTSNTQIIDNGVTFNVHWDVEIHNAADDVISEIINHVAESSIKLKKIHETAAAIIEAEMRELKLEDITQDLIALEHPDVPLAGIEFGCSTKTWKISKVKSSIQDLLRVNLAQLKVEGTDFIEYPKEFPYYENHYAWYVGNNLSAPGIDTQFHYDNSYPFTFDVTPRAGTSLRSGQLGGDGPLVSALCMQTWKFVYDVSYPVLVDVIDIENDYRFKMAFTVHLNNNLPDRSEYLPIQPTLYAATATDEEYCQERTIPMTVFSYELVENLKTGVYSREALENVELSFTCLRYGCDVAKTQYDFAGLGSVAGVRANFPYCAGGILRGEKDGYKENWERVLTIPNKQIELDLTPLFNFPASDIKFIEHDFDDLNSTTELEDDKTVLVQIKYTKPGESDPFHETSLAFSSALDEEFIAEQKLEFLGKADFTYYLDISVLNDDNNLIGGYKGEWEVDWESLVTANELTFHVVTDENANDNDLIELFTGLPTASSMVPVPELE
ncbi:hypothetical protein HOI26_05650 [Candidatus Woesearchaeota archaeon]|nr:hypothetical protein [Candidatus Woesearchaeota archaeon]MBT5740552.1 hypothetical protein [Candidatus Woesearchaeota archaeon]